MKEFPALRNLIRVFIGMALIGGCLVIVGIMDALLAHSNETPVVATVLIGIGAIMILLGLRAVFKGRQIVAELNIDQNIDDETLRR